MTKCARLIAERDRQWTAEMLLIFSLQRPDVVSFGDLAIQRGMRMLLPPPPNYTETVQ